MEKSPLTPRGLRVLALKRLILDLVEWSGLPDKPQSWPCQGLRARVNEATADLPKYRSKAEREDNRKGLGTSRIPAS